MSTKYFGLVLVLSVYLAMPPAVRAAATAVRKSADGIELPLAAPDRKFRSTVPIGGQMLGQKPEDIGRVFNARQSAVLLSKRTTQDLGSEWFVLNGGGADVAGLSLTSGRASRVALFYASPLPAKIAAIRKQIESKPDHAVKVTITPIDGDKKQSLMVVFEADPIEFYLASHSVDRAISDALRARIWISAMTDEQATLVGDGPGKYQAIFAPDAVPGEPKSPSTIFNDNATADIRMVFEARSKDDARKQALTKHKNLKELSKLQSPKQQEPQ